MKQIALVVALTLAVPSTLMAQSVQRESLREAAARAGRELAATAPQQEPKLARAAANSTRRSRVPGAIIGAAAGAAVGLMLAPGIAMKPCGRSCSDEKFLLGFSLVGLPLIGGVVGGWAWGKRNDRQRSASFDSPAPLPVP